MDGVVVKRGAARKRKATAAGIQSQNKETPAPGSAEVREAIFRWLLHHLARVLPTVSTGPRLANSIRRAFPSADQAPAFNLSCQPEQRAAMKEAEELATQDTAGASVKDFERQLSDCTQALLEQASTSGSHVECIVLASKVVRAITGILQTPGVALYSEKHNDVVSMAHGTLLKAIKIKIPPTSVRESVPRLVLALKRPTAPAAMLSIAPLMELQYEVWRRAADALAKLVVRDQSVRQVISDEDLAELVAGLTEMLERAAPRESRIHRAAANALIALDVHETMVSNLKSTMESFMERLKLPTHTERDTALGEMLLQVKRNTHTLGEVAKQDANHVDTLIMAGTLQAIMPVLQLGSDHSKETFLGQSEVTVTMALAFVHAEKEACQALGNLVSHANSRAEHQKQAAEAGAIGCLIGLLVRPLPPAPSGISTDARRLSEALLVASNDLARRAADALTKIACDNDEIKARIIAEDGVQTLRLLLERRDSKVQRAAAGALITLGEHERLVTETLRIHDRILARPDERRLRDVLKQSVRTLAELAKESQAFNQSSSDGDMVDAVVRAGAVEAIVPLLSLSQAIGEECTASIGDIEKEASYAISLLASKDVNQNRIAEAGALPGLVALLKRYPPQLSGQVPPSVARRAADAVTNLAHENNSIKNQVRTEGGIPPLVSLLETRDAKVQRAAASALRTLAFKNDENKNQIVECGALPNLIFMVKSDDQAIHYEAVGVIGNLVHSSLHIKRRVLDEGALQPVIGLLSSDCPESQREAALLLGQFATTEPEFKIKIVQRGAVAPLIQMLNNNDSQLREMAAFALGRLAQNPDNQVGICHGSGLRPLLDLLDSNVGNLQHNAAFALYGLADHEDNVPDIVREGTVQRLKDRELIVQASKDCVQKTLKRLEDKMTGRVLRYLIYLMTTSNKVITHRIAVALAYLCRDEDMRLIFMEKGGMDILLNMLVPKFGHHESMKPNDAQHLSNQKDAATALHIVAQKVGRLCPEEDAPLPPTPQAYLEEHFNNPELSDIRFVVGDREFHAHKIAFTHCFDAFHEMIESCTVAHANSGESAVVEVKHITASTFEALMRFIYTGALDVNSPTELARLLRVAHEYDMTGLKRRCEAALVADVKNQGADLDPNDMLTLYHVSRGLQASSVSRACALHALEHRAKVVEKIGQEEFTEVVAEMAPLVREHLHSMFYRLGDKIE